MKDEKNVIVLPKELNIQNLDLFIDKARKIIPTNDEMIVDAQNIEVIDTAGLQLILSIAKTALLNNVKFQLINASPSLQRYVASIIN